MISGKAPVVGVGEILWDKLPDGDSIGGAPFNVVANLRRLGHAAAYVTAVGRDAPGAEALSRMRASSVDTSFVERVERAPTGEAGVSIGPDGSPVFVIPRPVAFEYLRLDDATIRRISSRRPWGLVYGTIAGMRPAVRGQMVRLMQANPGAVRLYDVNLREGWWTADAVAELIAAAAIVKFSEDEARTLAPFLGLAWQGPEAFTRELALKHGLRGVALTAGGSPASLLLDGTFARLSPPGTTVADAVGAGDAFAAGLLDAVRQGLPASSCLRRANALGAIVASRTGAQPDWTPAELDALQTREERGGR